jgi:hypothetical protein
VRGSGQTPAEFELEVVRDIPESTDGLAALTRAYESVRYGARSPDNEALRALDVERRVLLRAIAEREPLDRGDEDPQGR